MTTGAARALRYDHIVVGTGAAAPPRTTNVRIIGDQLALSNGGHLTPPTYGAAPTARLFQLVDGTSAAPLTGMSQTTPTFAIERWDASVITGSANIVAAQVALITPSGGHSDAGGGFTAFLGFAAMQGSGTGSGISNTSTHVGLWGIGQLESTADKAFSLGLAAVGIIDAGSGPDVRATGAELGVVNNRGDATGTPDAPGAYYTLGAYISSGGSGKALCPLFIDAPGGKWITGIYVKDIVDNGIGLTLKTSASFAPAIQFINSDAEPCYLSKNAGVFQVIGHSNAAMFGIDLATGEITTKAALHLGASGAGAYLEGWEQTAPAAPAANGYRLYAEDTGGGKTRLVVLFASGAAQVLATQP